MKTTLKILVAILFALLVALTALAQDATSEPTQEPTAAATQEAPTPQPEATAIVIDINVDVTDGTGDTESTGDTTGDTGGAGTDLPEGNVSIPGWSIIMAIVMAVGAGVGVAGIIDRVRRDPRAMTEIESRANTVAEPLTQVANKFGEGLEAFAKLLREATDRIPAATKPVETSALYNAETPDLIAELRRRGVEINTGTVTG